MIETEIARLRRRLNEMVQNLWWTWNIEAAEVFQDIDQDLWGRSNHNPIVFLANLTDEELAARVEGKAIESRINFHSRRLEEYLDREQGFGHKYSGLFWRNPIAYFCAEFGLHESLPIYSGGLGILAGDHLKSASDLNLPMVGVGLLYHQGYFNQTIDAEGWQQETYGTTQLESLPMRPVLDPSGRPLAVSVRAGEDLVRLRLWRLEVGRVRLFLLDSDLEDNAPSDRELTRLLYGGTDVTRIRQEILLGIGGVRALRAMGVSPAVLHLNEGHCAFAPLELIRVRIQERGEDFATAQANVKLHTLFTTHTPVPAGHDRFSPELVDGHLRWLTSELGVDLEQLLALGRVRPDDPDEPFCMTVLAFKLSRSRNAVSALHGEVTRRMWKALWPAGDESEVPIGHITNGVHVKSWLAPSMSRLYVRHLGPVWERRLSFPEFWQAIEKVSDAELWEEHQLLRHMLVSFVRQRLALRRARQAGGPGSATPADDLDFNALTIGFARRFATYKRAWLIFSDLDRLAALLSAPGRPVQIVFAGKAHPRDQGGKRTIQEIVRIASDPRFQGRIAFVEDFNISVARHFVQGVDLWLNTPERPQEACGTSGQKVLLNGGLNCSTLDGWWAEGSDGRGGFDIGEGEEFADRERQRASDAEALYRVLEEMVVPEFYDRDEHAVPVRWVRRIKHAIRTLGWRFNSDRMVKDYFFEMYLPSAGATSCGFPSSGGGTGWRASSGIISPG